jgi:hypothetical protein
MTGHGDTGSLDLAGGNPRRLKRLDPIFTLNDLVAAFGLTTGTATLLLAVFNLLRHQHG